MLFFLFRLSLSISHHPIMERLLLHRECRKAKEKEFPIPIQKSLLSRKVEFALKNDLKVIFCIGERLLEREKEEHFTVVENQLKDTVFKYSEIDFSNIIIAYEPVWAIGTGVTATSQQAQDMHSYIRYLIEEKYSLQVAENTSILYGGSCNPKNAKELFVNKDVDGGLIGGASLEAEDFIAIVNSF